MPNECNAGSAKPADTLPWFTPWRFGLILAAAIFAAFPKVILGWESFFYRDYGVLAYPFAFYQHESFWRGELPLWNPLSHCGVPCLAQWGTSFYPFGLFYLIFPLPWSLSYFCLAHLFLAGLGMYRLAQRWTGSPFAASVAGLAYVFNGVTLSSLIWPNYPVALGWLPWIVLCGERSWRDGGRWVVIAAVVTALQLFSGAPEIILLTWILLGVLWLNELAHAQAQRARLVTRFVAVVALAAGLFMVQLLPFVDLLAHSQRDTSFGTSKWAMPVWGWANLLVPLFHCFETPQGPWFPEGEEFFNTYYLGAGLLVLALWAAWRVQDRRARLLAALGLFGLIMALGEHGYVFTWVKQVIPLVGIARYPVKCVVLAALAVPLLAAWAISRFENLPADQSRSPRSLMIMGVVALVAMAALLWFVKTYPHPYDQWPATWHNALGRAVFLMALLGAVTLLPRGRGGVAQRATQGAILAVIVLDLFTHVPKLNPTLPVAVFAPGLWEQNQSQPPPKLGQARVMITRAADQKLLRSNVADQQLDFVGKRLASWSNLNLLDTVPKVNGAVTLQIREQKQVEALLFDATNAVGNGLLDFLAVSHVSAPDNPVEWVKRTNFCPVATCGQRPVFESAEKTLRALAAPEFDPRTVVYLPAECRSLVTVDHPTQCTVVASHWGAERVELEVAATEPSLVVLSRTFYHPWQASVDGQKTPLLRANHAFQAVQVPAGRHHIALIYRDWNLLIGAGVSGVTALLCLVLYQRRGPPAKPEA